MIDMIESFIVNYFGPNLGVFVGLTFVIFFMFIMFIVGAVIVKCVGLRD